MARLKLATYNINGIRARLPALLEWLEREQPDIACLQELKAPDDAFPAADIERLGYGAIWHGQKSWNGVAILARGTQPEERRRGLPGGADDTHSRYLEASVHGLVVGALYLPNGNPWPGPKFEYKLAWFERLIRHARKLLEGGGPVVLAGDFNVVPTDELDIYDPKSWRKDALLQPESREAWLRLLEQGWTDSLRAVAGDARVFTFWDYFRRHWERDAGLRIDHVLLSPELAGMLADAGVDRWVRGRPGASDHAPTWVVLDTDGNGATGAAAKRAARKVAKKPTARRGAVRSDEPSTRGGEAEARTRSGPRTMKKATATKTAAQKAVRTRAADGQAPTEQAPAAAGARRKASSRTPSSEKASSREAAKTVTASVAEVPKRAGASSARGKRARASGEARGATGPGEAGRPRGPKK